jgi:hypothetical protein
MSFPSAPPIGSSKERLGRSTERRSSTCHGSNADCGARGSRRPPVPPESSSPRRKYCSDGSIRPAQGMTTHVLDRRREICPPCWW